MGSEDAAPEVGKMYYGSAKIETMSHDALHAAMRECWMRAWWTDYQNLRAEAVRRGLL